MQRGFVGVIIFFCRATSSSGHCATAQTTCVVFVCVCVFESLSDGERKYDGTAEIKIYSNQRKGQGTVTKSLVFLMIFNAP